MALFIQDTFIIEQNGISLSDALILPKSEYEALSPAQVTSLKNARFTAHKERLLNPPVIPQPTNEEVLADIDRQLVELSNRRVEVEEKVSNKPVKNASINYHKGN